MSRPGRSLLRLVGVLVVLVGLIAMHQLAGGPHRMPTAVQGAHSAVPAGPAHEMAGGHLAGHVVGHVVGAAPAPLPVVLRPALHVPAADAGHGMATCLAVLVGLLVVVTGRGVRPVPAAAVRLLDRSRRTSPPGRGPPRALLAQLCVLRT